MTIPQAPQAIGARQIHLDFHTSEHLPDIGKRLTNEELEAPRQRSCKSEYCER